MARKRTKKGPPPTPGAPLWMATFADIAILLLCFLVLILSFSTLDEPSFLKVTGSIKRAFGVQAITPAHEIPKAERIIATVFETVPFEVREPIQQLFRELEDAGLVTVEEDEAGEVTVRIRDSVAFAFGRADLKEDFKALLDQLGEILVTSQATMVVEGHTDNVPMRPGAPFSSNWALSAARSVAVVEYLLEHYEIPRDRLAAEAYADSRPVAPNDTAEGRAANRRVEFRIRPGEDLRVFEGFEDFIDLDRQ
ncbi:OmpA family protein [Desulfurivibrio alkaliphilus]|uniref:OmpA/MotB domain protein n=1 Tax=Desulfurivibrio alkaliphilus (strain DSM 19089 / UNIQEM U267 / AHT2) TaxID=589865 RepID=D6Z2X5_DESAT|nr:OmpA family protein [Desulfurivibrio alkaliphilus]ADH85900.1 OmpA/MotB domain protein [Desulfurivibrio alkaliphilus AHT 2]